MKILLLILVLFISAYRVFAQVDTLKTPTLKVTLKDSTTYIGRIIKNESDKLIFQTRSGVEISIPKNLVNEIYRMQDLPKEKKAATVIDTTKLKPEIQYTDRNVYKLFLFPTAKPLKNGDAFVSLNELFFPYAAVGIKNILTLGGGISILPDLKNQLLYYTAKATFLNIDKISAAAGFFNFATTSNEHWDSFGAYYLLTTYGTDNHNFTLGIGKGLSEDYFDKNFLFLIGGQSRLKANTKLIFELWYPNFGTKNAANPLVFFGLRFFNESFSGDIALFRPLSKMNSQGFIFYPWLAITYNFNLYKAE